MKEPDLETARKVISNYPTPDDYVQDHFRNGMYGGEYWDNTIETFGYWNQCKKIVEANEREKERIAEEREREQYRNEQQDAFGMDQQSQWEAEQNARGEFESGQYQGEY